MDTTGKDSESKKYILGVTSKPIAGILVDPDMKLRMSERVTSSLSIGHNCIIQLKWLKSPNLNSP